MRLPPSRDARGWNSRVRAYVPTVTSGDGRFVRLATYCSSIVNIAYPAPSRVPMEADVLQLLRHVGRCDKEVGVGCRRGNPVATALRQSRYLQSDRTQVPKAQLTSRKFGSE